MKSGQLVSSLLLLRFDSVIPSLVLCVVPDMN